MTEKKTGTVKEKLDAIGALELGPGEAHLQNKTGDPICYCCHKKQNDNMVLMRTKEKDLSFVCLDHPGVIQEFLRQFRKPPLGWKQSKIKD